MDCYLMYPDRTWIVISCIPNEHGLLSHVSWSYMDCYLMHPDRITIHVWSRYMRKQSTYGQDTWDNNSCTVGKHEILIHVRSGYMRLQSMYGRDTWDNNYMDCYHMYPDRTWIVISCIPTVHGLLSPVSRTYMDCYLMYADRTWIAISCILTVHGLLSHVSRPYMNCYLMYPDRTWIVISCIPTVHVTIHVRSGYMR
jgi:hypothetical protein